MKQSFTRILNYLGLTIAFTAFMVIMVQVQYEASFCSNYKDAERTYRVERGYPIDDEHTDMYFCWFSRPMLEKIKDAPEVQRYVRFMGSSVASATLRDIENTTYSAARATGMMYANSATLEMMNVEMVCGTYDELDSVPGVVISEPIAEKMFGKDSPLGKNICISQWYSTDTLTIRGVFKPIKKNGLLSMDIAATYGDFDINQHNNQSTIFCVTLHEGVTAEEACASMQKLADEYVESEKDVDRSIKIRLTPIEDVHFLEDVGYDFVEKSSIGTLIALITVALIIILVAMVNFWNIAFASVPSRIKSINTRKVLGASREELIGGQILEVVVMALCAFVTSLLLLFVLRDTAIGDLVSEDINPLLHLDLVAYTAIGVIVLGALAGLSPAFYSTSFAPALVLKGSFSHNIKGRQLRYFLIGFQFTVSLVLGMVAMFVNEQMNYMLSYDKGFSSENVLYSDLDASLASKHKELAANLKKHPEIVDVTFSAREFVPQDGLIMNWGRRFEGESISFQCQPVERNFAQFFDIKIIDGRYFEEQDENTSNAHFIFNATAKAQYPFIDVGDTFWAYATDDDNVVGISEDFHLKPLQYNVEPLALFYYDNNPNESMSYCYVKIASGLRIKDVEGIFEEEIRKLHADVATELISLNYYDENIAQLYEKERKLSSLNFMACILSILIAVIGILGLITFETQYRKKEIAVRRVLGASTTEILGMFNGIYVRLCVICFVVAAPIAYLIMSKWVEGYAYQADIPVWIFVVALIALFAIVTIAITSASLRAINRDPVESIKTE